MNKKLRLQGCGYHLTLISVPDNIQHALIFLNGGERYEIKILGK
jgi:hypothetical protein